VAASGKELVRRLIDEVVNARDTSALEELADGTVVETARRWIEPFRAAFPDFRMEIVELVAEGNKVAAHFRCSGTHLGDWLGQAPTGRRFQDVNEIHIFTVRDGRLLSAVAVEDNLSRARQLGLAPFACTLQPAQMPQRGDEIRSVGRAGLQAMERGEREVTLYFRRDPDIRERVQNIVAAKSNCCRFLDFTITDEDDVILLTVAAPEGAEWAVHGLGYLFAADAEVPG
jgi:predicted ester cyclase